MAVERGFADGVLTLTLNRPDKLNALTPEMKTDLVRHFRGAHADPEVRAVLLAGAGRAFCAGGDVGTMGEADLVSARARNESIQDVVRAIYVTDKPVIAAVRGAAVGAGFGLAMACDLIVASETAKFSQVFKRIGLGPDAGASLFLTQRMGVGRAKELVYSARMVAAVEAEALGFVARVVPDDALEGAALELAREMAESAPLALAASKRLFRDLDLPALDTALAREIEAQTMLLLTEDHREGVRAFKEKRAPQFTGH